MSSKATYTPDDEDLGLAAVGEVVTFTVSGTNIGNVDIHGATVSNELFKNDEGGYCLVSDYTPTML